MFLKIQLHLGKGGKSPEVVNATKPVRKLAHLCNELT